MTRPDEIVIPVVDEGLGNSAYVVDLGDGRALAIDPSRDLRRIDDAARGRRLAITMTAETHLHADFVSGATRLSARDRAGVVGSAAGGREFPHVGLHDGDEVDLGGLRLRAWATPGHTAEHLSYLLVDGDRVRAVFTGGSLIVGAAARTDLVSPDRTEPLARAQFHSLRRLAQLPDDTPVYPTHGAGSFCAAPPEGERVTTIGREKAANALLRIDDEDRFVEALLSSLGSFPAYFRRLAEVNRRGPALPTQTALPALSVAEVIAWRDRGAEVVDVRPVEDYAAGHIPCSLSVSLRPAFATWLGWLVPSAGTPLVFLRNADQDPEEILWQASKIGYDRVAGEVADGIRAWHRAGGPVRTNDLVSPEHATAGDLLDVRQRGEYLAGHVPGVEHVELGALAGADLRPRRIVTICGHRERAASAASVLERSGHYDVGIFLGGPADWARAAGAPLACEP
jgi:glyoxylase-like metal-dependent hydrolase (beta-lactamase superfamily II)/rhodanese-related sulfurtransferase